MNIYNRHHENGDQYKRKFFAPSEKRINSYGLIVKHKDKYLLVQNRDSEAFIYFFFANITKWTETYCIKVFRNFSSDEKQRLLYYPFHLIYVDLYINYDETIHKRQYEIAKRNFDYFKSMNWMINLLRQSHTREIPFLFPKGRLESNETFIDCAIREFIEETNIDISEYKSKIDTEKFLIYETYRPFYHFISVNKLYFLEIPSTLEIKYTHFSNRIRSWSISNEILHSVWVSQNDLNMYLFTDIFNKLKETF